MRLHYPLSGAQLGDLAPVFEPLLRKAEAYLENPHHGDFSKWKAALDQLPEVDRQSQLTGARVRLGSNAPDQNALTKQLMAFHPWRKGPFNLAGIDIDTEWRSDWKWDRLAKHINLKGQCILDIGCGNGYFGWRMLGAGAELVVGIDPTLLFVMQYFACQHFAGSDFSNIVLPYGIEDLPEKLTGFDSVFSMGVLYHRRSPIEHLQKIRSLCRPGGQIVLETLVIDGNARQVLVPEGRYARMRNVWFLPSAQALLNWLKRAGFKDPVCVSECLTTVGEQRRTDWMQFESLAESLDPEDQGRTIEGLPAPRRAIFIATKKV